MLDTLVTLLSSGGVSAIAGGVLGYMNRKEDRKSVAQEQEHSRQMAVFNLERDLKLADKDMEKTRVHGEMAENLVNSEAFSKSVGTGSRFSEIIKSAIRPIILVAYTYQTYLVFTTLTLLVGGIAALDPLFVQDLFKITVLMIINMAAMSASWYFAQRPSKQFNQAMGELYGKNKTK